MAKGKFIISLDFELRWGGAEKWDVEKYKDYFLNTRNSIPQVLELLEKNNIHATWATVGFLFANDKKQLEKFSPNIKPTYLNKNLSYYNYFNQIGENELEDPIHYAPSLIKLILKTKGQELATHTFSHFYCQEEGQTIEQFESDLKAVQAIAKENYNTELKSLVFPRNQYNKDYLDVAKNNGIKVIRSNPNVWFWQKSYGSFTPIFRALDTLISISNSLSFDYTKIKKNDLIEIPASRFFRPFSKKEKIIQSYKLNRIKSEMTSAAKNGLAYHLWWHPHNFANDISSNLFQLKEIIEHYNFLNQKYDFESVSMIEMYHEN